MLKKIIFVFILAFIISCNSQSVSKIILEKYSLMKKEFNDKDVDHFPNSITFPYNLIENKNKSKNDICLLLYQYDAEEKDIDSVLTKNAIAKYDSDNECLLIVNRFQTLENRDFDIEVEITDSTKINRNCYKGLYPIPSFIDYQYPNAENDIKLDKDFKIYVLEAKPGNFYKKFNLSPNPQMPKEWENGFSKGIAISKSKKTIIYWSIIW